MSGVSEGSLAARRGTQSRRAARDIGERNPRMAATLADKIAASVARLADHPRSGRPGGRRNPRTRGARYFLHRRLHGAGGLREDPPSVTRRVALAATTMEAGSAQAR